MSEAVQNDFIIDSDAKAMWALKKIREARTDCDYMVSWYQQKIKEIKDQTDFDTMNLERMLSDYFQTVPHHKTKTQESYSLPGGFKLILKAQNPEYKRDDKKVIEWLEKNSGGQFVKTEKKLDWDGLKKKTAALGGKVFTEDGEEIPGIDVIDREPKFTVEV